MPAEAVQGQAHIVGHCDEAKESMRRKDFECSNEGNLDQIQCCLAGSDIH